MQKRALVTGATGFVGGALVERLVTDGWQVTVLVRPGSDTSRLESLGVDQVFGDVCREGGLVDAVDGVNTVFHCAALTGVGHSIADFQRVIAGGTKNLLSAALMAGVKRFIFVSSVAVYELDGATECDEQHPLLTSSIDPYANAKIAAETACLSAHEKGRFEVSIVRPVFIYGPGDRRGGFLPELVSMISKGKFKLIGGGDHQIPLVYISDLLNMLLLCAERPEASGQVYNACSRSAPSWRALTDVLCGEFSMKHPGSLPAGIVRPMASLLESLTRLKLLRILPVSKAAVNLLSRDVVFPVKKAEEQLAYVSQVGFSEGLMQTLPSLKSLQQVL